MNIKNYGSYYYRIPPPIINLTIPITIAMMFNILPFLELLINAKINPIIANGIFNQLNQPKNGIKPNNIPSTENIPNMTLKVPMILIFMM